MSYGATPADWEHFSSKLGLTEDLLPVVSNPEAQISEASKMKQLGKTPSIYNKQHKVIGLPGWTEIRADEGDARKWSLEPDYGICVQTRRVRAIDIDMEDGAIIGAIIHTITEHLGALPTRYRPNSNKCLLIFQLEGELPKRVLRTDKGIVELLGTGQQFIASGTHPSGARYEWHDMVDGLPGSVPAVTLEQLDDLWSALAEQLDTTSTTQATQNKAEKIHSAMVADPVAKHLLDNGMVKSTERDGRLHIVCPFEAEHTSASSDSATTYFPAHTGGYQFGHFDCKHAHCEHRSDQDFKDALGLPSGNYSDHFEVLTEQDGQKQPSEGVKSRFCVVSAAKFAVQRSQEWLIKKVLPRATLGVLYGESGAGKSFFALDIMGAIAAGADWRNNRATKGKVVCIVAEGAGGMRARLRGYASHHGVDLAGLDIGIIADAPNLMEVSDTKDLLQAIKAFGKTDLIVVDTFAQVIAGANENSGEDVGRALKHCKALHKHTGALVLLVHHSGKDSSKGARGWSGLRAAADVEIEVVRDGDDRVATVTKMKDGTDGAQYGFKLLSVPVWRDEDGDEVTTCVVEATEARAREVASRIKARGGNEKVVLAALNKLLGPGSDGRVSYHELMNEAVSHLPYDEASGKRDRRRDTIAQAVGALRDTGKLEVVDGAWITLPGFSDLV